MKTIVITEEQFNRLITQKTLNEVWEEMKLPVTTTEIIKLIQDTGFFFNLALSNIERYAVDENGKGELLKLKRTILNSPLVGKDFLNKTYQSLRVDNHTTVIHRIKKIYEVLRIVEEMIESYVKDDIFSPDFVGNQNMNRKEVWLDMVKNLKNQYYDVIRREQEFNTQKKYDSNMVVDDDDDTDAGTDVQSDFDKMLEKKLNQTKIKLEKYLDRSGNDINIKVRNHFILKIARLKNIINPTITLSYVVSSVLKKNYIVAKSYTLNDSLTKIRNISVTAGTTDVFPNINDEKVMKIAKRKIQMKLIKNFNELYRDDSIVIN